MGTAAKLDRVARHREHAHDVAVFLLEDRDRAALAGLVDRQHFGQHGRVGEDLGVHEVFDADDLVGREGLAVRKIEAQAVGADQRPLLRRLFAQNGS